MRRFSSAVLLGKLLGGLATAGAWVGPASAQPASAPADVAASRPAAAEETVTVRVEGEGLDRAEAIESALRAAVEAGGRVEIFSDTRVRDFQLVHDTIIARARGIVTDYEIIDGPTPGPSGDTVKVRIEAKVSKRELAETWGEVQHVLNLIGRPRVMVHVRERIDGTEQPQGILETQIEQRLLASGFELVDRSAVEAAMARERSDAQTTGDLARLRTLARGFGAHVLITGTANADAAGVDDNPLAGEIAFYHCDAEVKAYYTDTGRLLASAAVPLTRRGARGHRALSPQAGRRALAAAGQHIVETMYRQIMQGWSTALATGRELTLEVRGVDYAGATGLEDALSRLDPIEQVHMDFTLDTATYRIKAKLSAEALAKRLTDGLTPRLRVIDLKPSRIRAELARE